MRRYLLVALWPAGMAAIAAATAVAARRASTRPDPPAPRDLRARATGPAGTAERAERNGSGPAERDGTPAVQPSLLPDLVRLGAIGCADGVVAYGIMSLLGPTVLNRGPVIDEPIVRWTSTHQVRPWAAVIERFDKIGHTWTTWSAAGTAAACLGMSYRTKRWLPPAALGAAVLVDKYTTIALRRRFGRPGPPGSPGGTYPSGGCDRVVFFYGLIAHLLWREYSGSRSGKVWAAGAVTALAFNQVYSRQYLSKHWFTDIISGTLYGAVLLAPFVVAVDSIAAPVRPVERDHGPDRELAGDSPSVTPITPRRRRIRLAPQWEGLARWLRVS
jgi:membrane-associated phospholipid phosphatase